MIGSGSVEHLELVHVSRLVIVRFITSVGWDIGSARTLAFSSIADSAFEKESNDTEPVPVQRIKLFDVKGLLRCCSLRRCVAGDSQERNTKM